MAQRRDGGGPRRPPPPRRASLAARPQPRRPLPRYRPVAPPQARSNLPWLFAAVIVFAAAVYVVTVRTDRDAVPPPPAAKTAQAPPIATGTAVPAPAKVQAPPPKPAAAPPKPPPAPPPAPPRSPAIPDAFLKELQEYKERPNSKALALAVDASGGWAFGAVAGLPRAKAANDEAMFDCERFREQASVQSPCRLFATDDKIVW